MYAKYSNMLVFTEVEFNNLKTQKGGRLRKGMTTLKSQNKTEEFNVERFRNVFR